MHLRRGGIAKEYVLISVFAIIAMMFALRLMGQGGARIFERGACILEGGTRASCGFPGAVGPGSSGPGSSGTGPGSGPGPGGGS